MTENEIKKTEPSRISQVFKPGVDLFAQNNARDAEAVGDDLKTKSEPLFARTDIINEICKWIDQLCQDCSGQPIEATEKRKAEASGKLIEISQKSECAKEQIVSRLKQILFSVNEPDDKIKLCEYVDVAKLLIRLGYKPTSEEVDKLTVILDVQSSYVDLCIPIITLIGKAATSGKDKAGKKLDQVFKSGGHPQLRIAAAKALINMGKKSEIIAYLKEKVLKDPNKTMSMRFEAGEFFLKNNSLLKRSEIIQIFEKILENPKESEESKETVWYLIKKYKLPVSQAIQKEKEEFDKIKVSLTENMERYEIKGEKVFRIAKIDVDGEIIHSQILYANNSNICPDDISYIIKGEKVLMDALELTNMPFSLLNIKQSIKVYKIKKADFIKELDDKIKKTNEVIKRLGGFIEKINKKIKEIEAGKKLLTDKNKLSESKIKDNNAVINNLETKIIDLRSAKTETNKAIHVCKKILEYFNKIKKLWNEVK